ncbi:hypothetical protein A9179_10620 [Pseudomonas alcaligenes]|uniref:Uncharacterized protein n=1 Tax=Aquipseudomonas alcaligenes TaxID=43263 RepID=A0ABR7S108_AQUAC|nr:hypothetical protein [Pseudomonas alcaligenes]MBC9250729.1 hypothetical protein [Pseudomonas alcaligenes]
MTSISGNLLSSLSGYTAISKTTGTSSNTNTTSQQDSEQQSDPVAEIKHLALMMRARHTGGLFAALAGSSGSSSSLGSLSGLTGGSSSVGNATIPLPDVAELDKDDAQKLLTQVQKLVDNGVVDGIAFKGSNGDQQTDSLTTYRDWLQAKVGIDTYV